MKIWQEPHIKIILKYCFSRNKKKVLHMLMIKEQGFYNLKLKKYKFKMSSIWLKCDELYNNRSTNIYLFQYHWYWILPLHCWVLFTWSKLHSTTNEISILRALQYEFERTKLTLVRHDCINFFWKILWIN